MKKIIFLFILFLTSTNFADELDKHSGVVNDAELNQRKIKSKEIENKAGEDESEVLLKSPIAKYFLGLDERGFYLASLTSISIGYIGYSDATSFQPHKTLNIDYTGYLNKIALRIGFEAYQFKLDDDWITKIATLPAGERIRESAFFFALGFCPGVFRGSHATFYLGPSYTAILPLSLGGGGYNITLPRLWGLRWGISTDCRIIPETDKNAGFGIKFDFGGTNANFSKIDEEMANLRVHVNLGAVLFFGKTI